MPDRRAPRWRGSPRTGRARRAAARSRASRRATRSPPPAGRRWRACAGLVETVLGERARPDLAGGQACPVRAPRHGAAALLHRAPPAGPGRRLDAAPGHRRSSAPTTRSATCFARARRPIRARSPSASSGSDAGELTVADVARHTRSIAVASSPSCATSGRQGRHPLRELARGGALRSRLPDEWDGRLPAPGQRGRRAGRLHAAPLGGPRARRLRRGAAREGHARARSLPELREVVVLSRRCADRQGLLSSSRWSARAAVRSMTWCA